MIKNIYTIGYSGYSSFDIFLNDLLKNKVNVLIDVRSNPYSAHFPDYNKEKLEKKLNENNIVYRNYSDEFGAKQLNKEFYSKFDGEDLRIDYDIFTSSKNFIQGEEKLETILEKGYTPCIMCSEKDPIDCHRAIMIGKVLFNNFGFNVFHITPDKENETQKQLECRIKQKIESEVLKKKKLNKLEQKMKNEIQLRENPSLIETPDEDYLNDILNYYKIINSHIGWKYNQVLGY